MKVLSIGGTGIISTAYTQLAIEQGIDITLLNRGRRSVDEPSEVKTLTANNEDTAELSRALAGTCFDAVVDWSAFRPADIERDITLFRGHTPVRIFQLRQRLPEAGIAPSHHRVDAARQPLLGVRAREDRLRRNALCTLTARRVSPLPSCVVSHLRRHANHARNQ